MSDQEKDAHPLKTKLDAMALEIAEKITVGGPVPQEVLKAMEVLTGLSKWYGIRQKLTPDGEGEGDGIDGYKKTLGNAAKSAGNQRGDGGGDDEFGHLAPDDAPDTERGGAGTGRRRNGVKKNGTAGYPNGSEYRHDEDSGGPDLDRIMASLPRIAGSSRGSRGRRGAAGDSAAGGAGVGGAGVASDAGTELPDAIGDGGV